MKPWRRQEFICALTEVTPNAKLVLFVLSRHVKDDTMACWPSQATLKRETGIKSDDGIIAAVSCLEARGVLTVVRPGKYPGRGKANVYTLRFDAEGIHGAAGYSTETNTPNVVEKYPENGSVIPRQPGTNLLTIKNHGASAPALEARAPRRPKTPEFGETAREKEERKLLEVANVFGWHQETGEDYQTFLGRIRERNQQRLQAVT